MTKTQLVYDSANDGSIDGARLADGSVSSSKLDGDLTYEIKNPINGAAYTDSVERQISERLAERVSVLDFGADPTGATDSTDAFAKAFAAAKTVYAPAGSYIVNNLQIPNFRALIGSSPTVQPDSGATYLRCTQPDSAIFRFPGSCAYITIEKIHATTNQPNCRFFQMVSSGDANTGYGQYLRFEDVNTYYGFSVSYDGFFIFATWNHCFDGYFGAPANDHHCFIRSTPDDSTLSSVGGTNVCQVTSSKIFRGLGTTPDRPGTVNTGGAGAVIIGVGSQWTFEYCDFESFTDCGALINRGVYATSFKDCWFESINHTRVIELLSIPAPGTGTFTPWPLKMQGCNFNLSGFNGVAGAVFIYLSSNSTPIPVGNFEWYEERVVLDSCNMGSSPATAVISNFPQQVLLLNIRGNLDNGNSLLPFADGARFVATKDIQGNLLNDTKGISTIRIRAKGLGSYGDGGIGRIQFEDINNDKIVSQINCVSYGSGTRGELIFANRTLDGNATPRLKITYDNGAVVPGANNTQTLGNSSLRWSEVYAVNPTINTSDENFKTDIRALTDKEKAVAKSIKPLIKAFRFKDAKETKGEEARIHFGIIAQEIVAAFEAESLDAFDYALVCKGDDGELGVRYSELLAFLISVI